MTVIVDLDGADVVWWRWRRARAREAPEVSRPVQEDATQTRVVIDGLQTAIAQLEGAYARIERLIPMVADYADTLPPRGRESGGDRA